MKAHSFYVQPYAGKSRPDRKTARQAQARAINQHVARKIKMLRVTHGQTQTKLGEVLGLTFQQVAKYEKAVSKVPPDRLWQIAEHFRVEIIHFFDGIELDIEAEENFEDPNDGDRILHRLRLEVADAIQSVDSIKILRSLLGFIRASSD